MGRILTPDLAAAFRGQPVPTIQMPRMAPQPEKESTLGEIVKTVDQLGKLAQSPVAQLITAGVSAATQDDPREEVAQKGVEALTGQISAPRTIPTQIPAPVTGPVQGPQQGPIPQQAAEWPWPKEWPQQAQPQQPYRYTGMQPQMAGPPGQQVMETPQQAQTRFAEQLVPTGPPQRQEPPSRLNFLAQRVMQHAKETGAEILTPEAQEQYAQQNLLEHLTEMGVAPELAQRAMENIAKDPTTSFVDAFENAIAVDVAKLPTERQLRLQGLSPEQAAAMAFQMGMEGAPKADLGEMISSMRVVETSPLGAITGANRQAMGLKVSNWYNQGAVMKPGIERRAQEAERARMRDAAAQRRHDEMMQHRRNVEERKADYQAKRLQQFEDAFGLKQEAHKVKLERTRELTRLTRLRADRIEKKNARLEAMRKSGAGRPRGDFAHMTKREWQLYKMLLRYDQRIQAMREQDAILRARNDVAARGQNLKSQVSELGRLAAASKRLRDSHETGLVTAEAEVEGLKEQLGGYLGKTGEEMMKASSTLRGKLKKAMAKHEGLLRLWQNAENEYNSAISEKSLIQAELAGVQGSTAATVMQAEEGDVQLDDFEGAEITVNE